MAQGESRLRSFTFKLLALLAGLLVALLLLEIILRIYNPFYARIKGNHVVLEGRRQMRFKNTISKKLDPVITLTHNSLGFRGPEPPPDFSDALTMVTIGGSTTACTFLSDDKTWPDRLSAHLENSFRSVWIDNAGVDGYSTVGYIAMMQDHVMQLHPKVVLFLTGRNDMVHEATAMDLKEGLSFKSPKYFLNSLSGYSEVAALIVNVYRSVDAYRDGLTSTNIDLAKQGYFEPSREVEEQYVASNTQPYVDGFATRLKRLIDLSRQANIEPVFITQPLLTGPAVDDVTGLDLAKIKVHGQANGEMWWDVLEKYNDVTRKVGRDNGVLVIDLARAMPKNS